MAEGYVEVCPMEELEARKRKRINAAVNGRYVTIFRFGEPEPKLYCIDTSCYHAGGSLALGDIEEVNGVPCIKCPTHQFRLSLTDGRQAVFTYDVVDDAYVLFFIFLSNHFIPHSVGPCYLHFPDDQSPKQRVHEAMELDGKIFVKLSSEGSETVQVASDRLAFRGDVVKQNGARVCTEGSTVPLGPKTWVARVFLEFFFTVSRCTRTLNHFGVSCHPFCLTNLQQVHCTVGEAQDADGGNRRRSTTLPGSSNPPSRNRAPTLPGSSEAPPQ